MEGISHVRSSQETVPASMKQGIPTNEELEKLGNEIGKKWKTLGRRLDINDPKLQEIQEAHDELSERGYQMLNHWKQEKGSAATYQALCDALKHELVQRQDLAEQFCFIHARVGLRIDCETISGPGQQGGSSEIGINSKEHEEKFQGTTVVPITSRKRRAEATDVSAGGVTIENDGLPSPQKVLSFIAFKVFQPVDPSKPEELNSFLDYMEKVRKVVIVDTQQGSLIITVACSSLEILDGLWEDYRTGHLNEMAQKYLVTEDILQELGLTEVKLTTTILEEEYRACREHLLQYSVKASGDDGQVELRGDLESREHELEELEEPTASGDDGQHEAAFERHKIMPVEDFQAEDYEALLKRQPFCSEQYHEREITRFFCLSCQSCVCQLCIATDHQNHEVITLDEAANKEKEKIMAAAKLTRRKEKVLKDEIRKFEETISQLETNVATEKRKVSQAAEQMIAKIREREREKITFLEKTRVTRLENINSANEKAQSLVKEMHEAIELAENVVKRSSSLNIMQNTETLKQRFQELRDVQVPQHHETPFIMVSVEDFGVGEIATQTADASQCTLEGLGQTLQAGVQAELILRPRTPEGKISNQPKLKNQIEVLIEPQKDVTDVNVSEKENGEFKVNFTPKVPGAYSIELKINGNKLPTCAFTMQVKERELVVVGDLDLKLFQGDELQGPFGIAVNTKGNIAITDFYGHCVYIFDKEGNCLRKIGSHGHNAGQFYHPAGVTYLNDNEILIAETMNNRIQLVDVQTGTFVKSFGEHGAAKGEFSYPVDVCLDEQHRIVVTECRNNRIQVMTQQGETIQSIFGVSGPENFNRPNSCIPYKNMFLVSDSYNDCIKVFDQSGTFLYKFGTKGNHDGQFNLPWSMLVDRSSNLLVCDRNSNRVQQFTLDGRFTGKTLTHLPQPTGIATVPDGRILVTSYEAKKVYILK